VFRDPGFDQIGNVYPAPPDPAVDGVATPTSAGTRAGAASRRSSRVRLFLDIRTDRYGDKSQSVLDGSVDAVSAAVGAGRTGVRISPQNTQNDIADSDPQALFNYLAEQLSGKGLAYLHIIEGDTFHYKNLKCLFGGLVIANNGFDKPGANRAIADGRADLVAFGKPFIANPDLVIRLFLDAPLMPVNRETLYGGSEQGYTDYPILRAIAPHACYYDSERAWG
jgi:N-ethylmaleimide reductase